MYKFSALYCEICKQKKEIGQLCYMQPLKNELLSSDKVLYVLLLQSDRIHDNLIELQCMFRICYAYSSAVRDVRAPKISRKLACSVGRDNIRYVRIRSGTFFLI